MRLWTLTNLSTTVFLTFSLSIFLTLFLCLSLGIYGFDVSVFVYTAPSPLIHHIKGWKGLKSHQHARAIRSSVYPMDIIHLPISTTTCSFPESEFTYNLYMYILYIGRYTMRIILWYIWKSNYRYNHNLGLRFQCIFHIFFPTLHSYVHFVINTLHVLFN